MKELLIDGRKSTTEIAKQIVQPKRIVDKFYRQMKKEKIIQGATIHINYKKFGYIAVASMQITTNPQNSEKLLAFIQKMTGIYAVHDYGPKGNIRVVKTLRTPQDLDNIKDQIKQQFPISNMKTIIWTDVKEIHSNLLLNEDEPKQETQTSRNLIKRQETKTKKDSEYKIDEIDLKIADFLSDNGWIAFKKIAQEIGISIDNVKRRYLKLKSNGFLKVTAQMDFTKIGYQAVVLFFLTISAQENSFSLIEQIGKISDVISIMKTIGDYDLVVYAFVRDANHLIEIQEKIAKIQGIARMEIEISKLHEWWPSPRQYLSTF